MVNARWFDGRSSVARTVSCSLAHGALEIGHEQGVLSVPAAALHLPEPAMGIDRPIGLPDGGVLWLPADAAATWLPQLRQAAGRRPGVAALIGSWPAVLLCLVLLLASLWWFNREGAGQAARALLPLVPHTVDQKIGEMAWPAIEARWLADSVQPERCERLSARFMAVARTLHDRPLRLSCRAAKSGRGFNAFALPDGHIVMLDDLLKALDDDEAMAVLGHELGHVVHRHGLQSLVRSAGLAAVAGVMLGDFSSVAVAGAATLHGLAYSRDAEREADRFALDFLTAAQLPPLTLQRVWIKFKQEEGREGGAGGIPIWLSSHPPTDERLKATESLR